jgi:hypothetical protein
VTYPEQQELLQADPLLEWIDDHFLRLDPYAFRESSFRQVISLVSKELGVDANGVFVIGSGAIGLSLNPSNAEDGILRAFDDKSDLDLAVISEMHFEAAWRDLRHATQPIFAETQIDERIRENLNWQKKRLFEGAIVAHRLLPTLSFGNDWNLSLIRVGNVVAQMLNIERQLNLWIYRDYWSLRNYVAKSIVRCRQGMV